MQRYLGVISGTSMDAIDVVTLTIGSKGLHSSGHYSLTFPQPFRQTLEKLCHPERKLLANELDTAAYADHEMGKLIATAVLEALDAQDLSPADITAIGSHGQNIRHRPHAELPFSWQIGNPSVIAHETGITTVADFRMADVAAGGQGAPLTPAFHLAAFSAPGKHRGILNLGGIANLTCLYGDDSNRTVGYDIGPANTLLDQWCQQHRKKPFDAGGEWALSGKQSEELVKQLLQEPYFSKTYPKSTGRELFNLDWLQSALNGYPGLRPEDIQRSLLELSARSIAKAINTHKLDSVYCCGGGVENRALMLRLQELTESVIKGTTSELGIHPQHVEGAAFAWFAHQTLHRRPANLPTVTGAEREKILGGIYYA